jgi:hypothetical protein
MIARGCMLKGRPEQVEARVRRGGLSGGPVAMWKHKWAARLRLAVAAFAPEGYEDRSGFHFGVEPRES